MRSTGFVVVSVMLHVLALSAVTLAPQPVHDVAGDTVEITMGEPSEHAGVADASAAVQTQAPPAPAPAPAPVAEVKAVPAAPKVVEKPVENVDKKPAPVKKVARKAPAPAPVKAAEAQKLDAAVTEDAPEAAPIEETKAAPQDEEPKLIPVKEMSPAGVQAATADEPAAPAAKEESVAAPAPAPVAAAAPAPVAAAAAAVGAGSEAGKTAEINGLTAGGELGKGGATPAGAVDVASLRQMAGNKAPLYPLGARREGRQGETTLLYRVTREGRVTDIKLENSSGSEDLDSEAMKAIAKFRFVPGQEGWARHPVHFNLKGDTAVAPSRLRTKVGEQ